MNLRKAHSAAGVVFGAVLALAPTTVSEGSTIAATAVVTSAARVADSFQFPLPTWKPHCLDFGSQWRLCDGTVLRRCSATGAVWLHTGVDIRTGIQPVMAAANGVIVG